MKTKIIIRILIYLLIMSCVQCTNTVIRRQEYIKTHPELSLEIRNAINGGKILIGMNQEQVIISIGRPQKISRTTMSTGIHEQWIYAGMICLSTRDNYTERNYSYVYFESGIVTSWQSR